MARRSQRLLILRSLCCQLLLLGLSSVSNRTVAQVTVAQVVPDTTLPNGERSQVSTGPLFQIDGGALRDRNLFHSFAQFSLGQGETAFFNNAATVTNIISRVTGGQPSNINGLIRVNGSANLFLINPSGVLFGPNASLTMGGTFFATTASAIQFGNQGIYSAINPDVPSLLTVNPSALLFNQLANQPIASQARLQVPNGQSLVLVGGNVLLDQGALLAPGGRVELGGLAGQGTVALSGTGSNLHLTYQNVQQPLADLTLINGAEVNVRSGGSIGITAQNVRLAGGSILRGGIAAGEGAPGSKAGDIDLNVPGAVVFTDSSFIANSTLGTGDSGNVNLTAGSIWLKDGSQINASTFGRGNGGTVTLRSSGVIVFDGDDRAGYASGTYSQVSDKAVGNSGGINLFAKSVTVTHGAVITASTFGRGNAGRVAIQALEGVQLKGDPSGTLTDPGGIYSYIGEKAIGNSSGISITARSLSVEGAAALVASTFGQGNGGDIRLHIAGAVALDGQVWIQPLKLFFSSGIFSSVSPIAQGNSGQISLNADSLTVTRGAAIATSALGNGKPAGVNINVAGAATFDGVGLDGFPSGIFGRVDRGGISNEGGTNDITFTARSLTLTNGAQFQTSTLGQRPAGSIQVSTVDDIRIVGKDATTNQSSGLFSDTAPQSIRKNGTVKPQSSGDGGNIKIKARSLFLQESAVISAQSQGTGNAGMIDIRLQNRLQAIDGQILTTSTQAAGGNIAIVANIISLRGDSDLKTSVQSGTGSGGNITLGARAIVALDDSDILAFSRDGSGGDITLNTPAFFGFRYRPDATSVNTSTLDDNGRVDVNASGKLRSGTVTLPRVTLQPSQVPLPTEVVDANRLIAHSCIARNLRQGSFIVTGSGGLPTLPDDLATAPFTTDVMPPPFSAQPLTSVPEEKKQRFDDAPDGMDAALVEIDGIYQLENGTIVLGRSCNGF